MAITSYSTLKTAIADWMARSDLTSVVDDFIDLAEADIARDLRVSDMVTALSATISSGVISVPTGFLEFVNVYVDGTPAKPLEVTTPDHLFTLYPMRSSDSKPRYIAKQGASFIFGPYPDSAYTIKGSYYAKLSPLGDGTGGTVTTNYLITDAPDLILAASLAHACRYTMDEARAQYWSQAYFAAVESAQARDGHARLSRHMSLSTVAR